MNPRLEGIIKRFSDNKGLTGDLPTLNEHFANYVILRDEFFKYQNQYPFESEIDKELLENLNFGKNKTESIDGFFCIIENSTNVIHIEHTEEEILGFIRPLNNVKIHIVLIQAKTSKLDIANILTLQVRLNQKSEDQENWKRFFAFRKTIEKLLKEKSDFIINFSVIYFSGEKIDSSLLVNDNFIYKLDGLKESIKDCLWANDVNVGFYDGLKIMELYSIQSQTAEAVNKTVDLHQITNTITCGDKTEMRLGLIKVNQLKDVLYDFNLKRPYQLYEYNVRHNLDNTGPNQKMTATLLDGNENFKFPLLNNGITMIVDSMSRKGDSALELKNIRIVNGCQTSHVILANCVDNSTYDGILVPLKVIATEDNDILSEITFSSNNQNPIKTENLISLNKNIIQLEKEYVEFNLVNEKKLLDKYYFERRQGQHSGIDSNFVVDIPAQSKIFIASWLIKPHVALQFKDRTLTEYNNLINNYYGDDLEAFCSLSIFSGVLWCKIYKNIRGSNYEPSRYHILCGVMFSVIQNHINKDYLKDDESKRLNTCLTNIKAINESLMRLLNNPQQLENEINKVKSIIDSLKVDLPQSVRGRIHYRKFYPAHIISKILEQIINK